VLDARVAVWIVADPSTTLPPCPWLSVSAVSMLAVEERDGWMGGRGLGG
jgi:hypothetical protein